MRCRTWKNISDLKEFYGQGERVSRFFQACSRFLSSVCHDNRTRTMDNVVAANNFEVEILKSPDYPSVSAFQPWYCLSLDMLRKGYELPPHIDIKALSDQITLVLEILTILIVWFNISHRILCWLLAKSLARYRFELPLWLMYYSAITIQVIILALMKASSPNQEAVSLYSSLHLRNLFRYSPFKSDYHAGHFILYSP